MSKNCDNRFKKTKLKNMLKAICKICDLKFVDQPRRTSVVASMMSNNFWDFDLVESNIHNYTCRYVDLLEKISKLKKDGMFFYSNRLKNAPDFDSLEELELVLTIRGLM